MDIFLWKDLRSLGWRMTDKEVGLITKIYRIRITISIKIGEMVHQLFGNKALE
jgi:hypothetical protein